MAAWLRSTRRFGGLRGQPLALRPEALVESGARAAAAAILERCSRLVLLSGVLSGRRGEGRERPFSSTYLELFLCWEARLVAGWWEAPKDRKRALETEAAMEPLALLRPFWQCGKAGGGGLGLFLVCLQWRTPNFFKK